MTAERSAGIQEPWPTRKRKKRHPGPLRHPAKRKAEQDSKEPVCCQSAEPQRRRRKPTGTEKERFTGAFGVVSRFCVDFMVFCVINFTALLEFVLIWQMFEGPTCQRSPSLVSKKDRSEVKRKINTWGKPRTKATCQMKIIQKYMFRAKDYMLFHWWKRCLTWWATYILNTPRPPGQPERHATRVEPHRFFLQRSSFPMCSPGHPPQEQKLQPLLKHLEWFGDHLDPRTLRMMSFLYLLYCLGNIFLQLSPPAKLQRRPGLIRSLWHRPGASSCHFKMGMTYDIINFLL